MAGEGSNYKLRSRMVAGPLFGAGSLSGILLGSEPSGFVFDPKDDQVLVRGSGLAPNFSGTVQAAIAANILLYTRGSTALYTGSNGLLQSAAIDTWRRDYDPITLQPLGFLTEPTSTNVVLNSCDFSARVKTDIVVSTDAAVAPDGTSTADLGTEGVAGTSGWNWEGLTVTAGQAATLSVFIKPVSSVTWYELIVGGPSFTNGANAWFNLSTGTIGTVNIRGAGSAFSGAIVAYPNGWFRISLSVICSTDTAIQGTMHSANADATTTRANNAATYLWGLQFEALPSATSFIQTTAVPVTRSGDQMMCDLAKIPYAQTGGSILSKVYSSKALSSASIFWTISDVLTKSFGDELGAGWQNDLTNRANLNMRWGGGGGQCNINGLTQNGLAKQASRFIVGSAERIAVDGTATLVSGPVVLAPTNPKDRLNIGMDWGQSGASTNNHRGNIDSIVYVPRGWTDTEMLDKVV